MAKKKVLVLLLAVAVLHACGEAKETCTCTCTCGNGEESTVKGASSEDDCSISCDMNCGADSYSSNYDCRTEGATYSKSTATSAGNIASGSSRSSRVR